MDNDHKGSPKRIFDVVQIARHLTEHGHHQHLMAVCSGGDSSQEPLLGENCGNFWSKRRSPVAAIGSSHSVRARVFGSLGVLDTMLFSCRNFVKIRFVEKGCRRPCAVSTIEQAN